MLSKLLCLQDLWNGALYISAIYNSVWVNFIKVDASTKICQDARNLRHEIDACKSCAPSNSFVF